MKKWPFVVGIFGCSLLFFISGTLVGYNIYDKMEAATVQEPQKKKRVPSVLGKVVSPLIGRVVDRKVNALNAKLRIPSSPAVQKALMYKSMIRSASDQ